MMNFNFLPIEYSLLASVATLAGAWLARTLRQRSINVMWLWAFSGGGLLALASLDLIPEAIALTVGVLPAIAVMAVFLVAGIIYWSIAQLSHYTSEAVAYRSISISFWRGVILITHSFIDGVAIGVSFNASATLGYIIALAIIAHDVSDGFNTIVLTHAPHNHQHTGKPWLWANAAAPLLGTTTTLVVTFNRPAIGVTLAALAGLFVAISLGEVLPTLVRERTPWKPLIAFVLGSLMMSGILWWATQAAA